MAGGRAIDFPRAPADLPRPVPCHPRNNLEFGQRPDGKDMRVIKILAPALLAASVLSACVDGPISSSGGGDVALSLAPRFSFVGNASSAAPIATVRTRPVFADGSGSAGIANSRSVAADDPSWTVNALVDLGGRDTATILVEIELLSAGGVIEWSGVFGPIFVDANVTPAPVEQTVPLLRGPLSNRDVESLSVHGATYMFASTALPAYATVVSPGNHEVRWSSSNAAVATVDELAGDSALVHAHASGSAWIHAAAGAHADSFLVHVDEAVTGEPAFVDAFPDSAVIVVGATRTWFAFVTDSAGSPLANPVSWQSLDAGIATVSQSGVVTGISIGRARIVATAGTVADTAIAIIETLPEGVDIIWQGGTPGAETDWFTADNWSPARVPTASDVVYFPPNVVPAELSADAEVGGVIGDTTAYSLLQLLENVSLTTHGDVIMPYVYGDSTTRLVMAGTSSTLWALVLPPLGVPGQVALRQYVHVAGDLAIESGGTLDVGLDGFVDVAGDLTVTGGGLLMRQDSVDGSYSYVGVAGDVTFDGGDSSNRLVGGYLGVGGDFTVTAASCTAFRPTDLAVELFSDTATISIGCAGLDGNRFWDLWIYSSANADRVITLQSDAAVANEFYMAWDMDHPAYVYGNGFTLSMRLGSIHTSTLDNTFVEVDALHDDYFYADSVVFVGMTGATRPQLLVNMTSDGCFACYDWQRIFFDPSSGGPYIELNDLVADGDSAIFYMQENPGDGPQRTVTTGEAAVYWADVAHRVLLYSGYGQTGAAGQPLPEPLVAQVVDYAYNPVEGATVSWSVVQGDGSVSPATSVSDTAGLAATQYTMGSATFSQHLIEATVPGAVESALFYVYPSAAPVAPAGIDAAQRIAPRARLIDRLREPVLPPATPQGPAPAAGDRR